LKHKKRYRKQYRHRFSQISNSANIVNLSSYVLSPAEISILSKDLSFVPKLKHIDQPDVLRGLCKFRNQVVNVYEANKRATLTTGPSQIATPSTTVLSQNTGTPGNQGSAAMIYRP
jgi:hypothetical protein